MNHGPRGGTLLAPTLVVRGGMRAAETERLVLDLGRVASAACGGMAFRRAISLHAACHLVRQIGALELYLLCSILSCPQTKPNAHMQNVIPCQFIIIMLV
jgi:hypothetical protein